MIHMKRLSQLSRADQERIAKSAGVPVAAGIAHIARTKGEGRFVMTVRTGAGAGDIVRHAAVGNPAALADAAYDAGALGVSLVQVLP
ncbi:hypothetical protein [Rugamonas sp.]|uniref:hypothetical protein n=1 Tax=Rugamonas sp. TaxID=1926287 RepID=UPI0025E58D75|nr:hypothetical protein [Rugamonas sp.]